MKGICFVDKTLFVTDVSAGKVMDVNPEFADDILLETLLTTQVENQHAVSHFKRETFTFSSMPRILVQS